LFDTATRRQIVTSLLDVVRDIADVEYQERGWIRHLGFFSDFDETMCQFFDDCNAETIVANPENYDIESAQHLKLLELYNALRFYSDNTPYVLEFDIFHDPKWHKIRSLAKKVLLAFNYPEAKQIIANKNYALLALRKRLILFLPYFLSNPMAAIFFTSWCFLAIHTHINSNLTLSFYAGSGFFLILLIFSIPRYLIRGGVPELFKYGFNHGLRHASQPMLIWATILICLLLKYPEQILYTYQTSIVYSFLLTIGAHYFLRRRIGFLSKNFPIHPFNHPR